MKQKVCICHFGKVFDREIYLTFKISICGRNDPNKTGDLDDIQRK